METALVKKTSMKLTLECGAALKECSVYHCHPLRRFVVLALCDCNLLSLIGIVIDIGNRMTYTVVSKSNAHLAYTQTCVHVRGSNI